MADGVFGDRKELLRRLVHALVGRLRRQHHATSSSNGVLVLELRLGIRIRRAQALEDLAALLWIHRLRGRADRHSPRREPRQPRRLVRREPGIVLERRVRFRAQGRAAFESPRASAISASSS
jgi:hypothetical protein